MYCLELNLKQQTNANNVEFLMRIVLEIYFVENKSCFFKLKRYGGGKQPLNETMIRLLSLILSYTDVFFYKNGVFTFF